MAIFSDFGEFTLGMSSSFCVDLWGMNGHEVNGLMFHEPWDWEPKQSLLHIWIRPASHLSSLKLFRLKLSPVLVPGVALPQRFKFPCETAYHQICQTASPAFTLITCKEASKYGLTM